MSRQVNQCPVCDAPLRITELSCVACDTRLHGTFPPPALARLPRAHQQFVETFLLCRGVIRDVEKTLGISYPTVRARLDAAVAALEEVHAADALVTAAVRRAAPPNPQEVAERRRGLLQQVEDGLIEPAEAAEALKHL